MYRSFVKRIIDLLGAVLLLIIASPLLLLAILFLSVAHRGRIFFIQPRPGKDERIFNLLKLKTMNDAMDAQGNLLPDKDRLTWAGKLVRATSMDELPQLFNVIKGDMSLIGPRPWLVEYLPLYNDFQRRRHEVKPGITGWAQVNGRNAATWDQRFAYDVHYVDHLSFALDLKILLLTILKILKMEGISGAGSVTMERFEGTRNEE